MKNNFFLILLSLIIVITSCQNEKHQKEFIGIITYKTKIKYNHNSYLSKNKNVTDSINNSIQKSFGDTMKLFIKKGNYKILSNGKTIETLYLTKDNKQYIKYKNNDSIYVLNCDSSNKTLINYSIKKDITKINGHLCNLLDLQFTRENDTISVKCYYDPKIYVNPEYYKDKKLGEENILFNLTKSICLKYIFKDKDITIEETAIKLEEKAIPDDFFNIPQGPFVEQVR